MRELINKELTKNSISLDSEKENKLEIFANKLKWYNQTHNITGAKSDKEIVGNIIDSLIPTTFLKEPDSLLDVGTGAGFPGLILAIIWDKTDVVLAEPLNKRAAFLRFVAIELELNSVTVFKDRVEKLQFEPFSLVTSRAVTDTKVLLSITKNVTNKKTNYLFYKGSLVYDELLEIKNKFRYDIVQREKRNYLWIKSDDN